MKLGKNIVFDSTKKNLIFLNIFTMINMVLIVSFCAYFVYYCALNMRMILLFCFLPPLLAIAIGLIYRFKVKKLKLSKKIKVVLLAIAMVINVFFSSIIIVAIVKNVVAQGQKFNVAGLLSVEKHGYLESSDFNISGGKPKRIDRRSRFSKNVSILVPTSFQYIEFTDGNNIEDDWTKCECKTDFSECLNVGIAKYVVKICVKEIERKLDYSVELDDLEWILSKKIMLPEDYPRMVDIDYEDYAYLITLDKKKGMREGKAILLKHMIQEVNADLWKADEVYYLDEDHNEIVIRKGKRVFCLSGIDFADDYNRSVIIEKLHLDLD